MTRWILPLALLTSQAYCGEGDYGYNYSCLPTNSRLGTFYLEGAALFFHADGEGLGFADLIEVRTPGDGESISDIKGINLDFEWDFGYRATAGYTFPLNGWDFKGSWTHFFTDATAKLAQDHPPISALVFTAWNTSLFDLNDISCLEKLNGAHLTVESQEAKGAWRWTLEDFSLLIGKSYYPSPCFALRPFLGLRGLYSSQTYNSALDQVITIHVPSEGDLTFEAFPISRSKCQFQALGLQAGLDMRWFFATYCDLFASLAFSSIRGRVKSSFQEIQGGDFIVLIDHNDINLNTLVLDTGIQNHYYDWKTVSDLTAGLRVGMPLSACRMRVSGYIAWEQHLFYHFNNFRPVVVPNGSPVTSTISQGDLSLWGLSAGISVDF